MFKAGSVVGETICFAGEVLVKKKGLVDGDGQIVEDPEKGVGAELQGLMGDGVKD